MFQNQGKGFEAAIGNGNLFDHAEEANPLFVEEKNPVGRPTLRDNPSSVPEGPHTCITRNRYVGFRAVTKMLQPLL